MRPADASRAILTYTQAVSVVPVLTLNDVDKARTLAATLVDVGAPVIEVTLRTPNALAVIEVMASVPGTVIAAGTVLRREQVAQAASAGAQFVVSPGYTDDLGIAAVSSNIPLLPGAATASEVMALSDKGYRLMKFFPAEMMGGVAALSALSGPFSGIQFCPTGGINASNIGDYLSLESVPFVGASYLVGEQEICNAEWGKVSANVRSLTKLTR